MPEAGMGMINIEMMIRGRLDMRKMERYEWSDKFGYDRNLYKRSSKQSGWVPTCFNCQEKRHQANNCPKAKRAQDKPAQVKVVIPPSSIKPKYVEGKIGANRCKILLDSGANLYLVDARFVRENQYVDQVVEVRGVNGIQAPRSKAKVWIHVDHFSLPLEVAVMKDLGDDAILGLDLGMFLTPLC